MRIEERQARTSRRSNRLADRTAFAPPDGRWLVEVRSHLDDGRIGRVLFGLSDGRMVLLHGFVKKSQRTPRDDLDLALRRLKEALT